MTAARLATLALVSLPFFAGSPAQATDLTFQPLNTGQTISVTGTGASFADQLSFTIGQALNISLSFTNVGLGSDATLSLFRGGSDIGGAHGREFNSAFTVPALAGTEFQVKVTGTDDTPGNPAYLLTLLTGGASPIPEVPTWGLVAAGLALVGTIARRRVRGGQAF